MLGNFPTILKYLGAGKRFVVIPGTGSQVEGVDTVVDTQDPDLRIVQSLLQAPTGKAQTALASPPSFTDQLVHWHDIVDSKSGACVATLWYDGFGDLNNDSVPNTEAERILGSRIPGCKVYGTVVISLPFDNV